MTVPDLVRIIVMFGSGIVVGAGVPILQARASFYRALGIGSGARAMYALMAVNALALGFACSVLIDRWHDRLSWRVAIVAVMFIAKAYFFVELRDAGLRQEAQDRLDLDF